MLSSRHQGPDLVVYGGSFDPPHLGHQYCINVCLDFFPKTKILVVPASAPVTVHQALKPATASFEHRLEMCRLAFEVPQEQRVTVSSLESEIDPPNYTLKTLKLLKEKYPDMGLCFLMGEDQWDHFAKWNGPLEILRMASVFVVRREPSAELLKNKIENVCMDLGLKAISHKEESLIEIPSYEACVYYQDIKPVLLASSDLRCSISDHGKLGLDEVSEEVESYIFSHRLYK